MIRAGLVDAAALGPGRGSLRLSAGYDSALGAVAGLEARHRFAPWLYGFATGDVSADVALDRLRWRALLGVGADW
jgi:hypothetical protein